MIIVGLHLLLRCPYVLWKSPEILQVLHEQRTSGIFEVITGEMDRRITLGQIPTNTPFLEAYKIVGDDLVSQALQNDPQAGTPSATPKIVDTRVAAPKKQFSDDDKVKAAAPSRNNPNGVKEVKNPLSMSDEDFLKQYQTGR